MFDLKEGDQVVYTGDEGPFSSWPTNGTIITRKKTWLDDDRGVSFTWINSNGHTDYHFFKADELEFIKE
jgi:hypothetical protein